MSRTPEVEAAMRMAREGLNGEHIADTSKQTVAWTISILAAEVERLEAHLKGSMQAGGYEYFVEQLRNAQRQAHNAIYVAQQLEKKVDELEALDELTTNQAKEYLARAEAAEADRDKWYGRCASLVWRVPSSVTAGEIQQWEADYKTELAKAEARVRELEHDNAKLRAALENELAENLRAEVTRHGTTFAKFVWPQQARLKAALADTKGTT